MTKRNAQDNIRLYSLPELHDMNNGNYSDLHPFSHAEVKSEIARREATKKPIERTKKWLRWWIQ